jgi:hypothetical protein
VGWGRSLFLRQRESLVLYISFNILWPLTDTLHTCRLAVLQKKANNKEQEEKDREFQVRELGCSQGCSSDQGFAVGQGCRWWPGVSPVARGVAG